MRNFVLLCIMMFLQFFIWGAWYVTAPNFLTTIGFEANDIGWTYSVGPIAGIIAPLFVGMVADRFMAAQKVLGLMHLAGGGLMFYATTQMKGGGSPDSINILFFLYMLTYYPTLALSNTVAMKNMSDSEKEFPKIRVFGTLGWIAAGVALTLLAFETNINMFYMTSIAALALGVISFALPNTPANSDSQATIGQLLGLDALALLKDKAYLIFMVSSILICIPLAFYYQIASRVVEMVELPIGVTMSYGQWSEVIFMLCIPFFFKRLGVKKMLAVGMAVWALRYALFAIGAPSQTSALIILGVAVHGICYDFFFVTGQIYTDKKAPEPIRAQAQGLLVMLTLGVGMFFGAKIAGNIEARFTPQESANFGYQVEAITSLEKEKSTSPSADLAKLVNKIESDDQKLEEKKSSLNELAKIFQDSDIDKKTDDALKTSLADIKKTQRLKQLQVIDWQKLWGIPAVFAGVILVFFMIAFKDDSADESDAAADVVDDGPSDDAYTEASAALETAGADGESCSTDEDCGTGG
ncbi:MAG: MFS transporter [Planctomycetaceae bacterium]